MCIHEFLHITTENLQVEFPVKHPNKIYISGLKEEVHSAISWIKRITKEIVNI